MRERFFSQIGYISLWPYCVILVDPMNFIRFENHAINVDNVAYVTRSDDNRVVLTFCAAKSESSLHLVLKGAGAEQVWDFFVKSSTATFGKVD
jgi:hypothetical protein